MDLSSPISSVIPSLHGRVLGVLARAEEPLSGRTIARLLGGAGSQAGVARVLSHLVRQGIALRADRPPAALFTLNRDHVGADAIVALAGMREALFERLRERAAVLSVGPVSVAIFGSAARGDGGSDSDIDLLIVRPDAVESDDPAWVKQLVELSRASRTWSGNSSSLIEYGESELRRRARSPLLRRIRNEAITIFGMPLAELLSTSGARR